MTALSVIEDVTCGENAIPLINTVLLSDEFPLNTASFLINLYCSIVGNSESMVTTNSLELIDADVVD